MQIACCKLLQQNLTQLVSAGGGEQGDGFNCSGLAQQAIQPISGHAQPAPDARGKYQPPGGPLPDTSCLGLQAVKCMLRRSVLWSMKTLTSAHSI